ncbi:hypothetical protein phi16_gp082 [Corynebacterium phage phi16]|uniref:hypothetical protein n=1 Tax=Corynebacterium glutamicum TaxID=1718 RepID=UPI00097E3F6F|nr:hypothetical protein [Corynebacterium glutamicum]APQ42585.1 hypothetical protein phi16_gp082 [Corynebacterium phage phi16]
MRKRPPRRKPGSRIISAEDYQRMLNGEVDVQRSQKAAKAFLEELKNADPNLIKATWEKQ